MSGECYHERNKLGKVLNGTKRIIFAGSILMAGLFVYDVAEHGFHLNISGINITIPKADGKAYADGQVIENTYRQTVDNIQCSNQITVDVGVNVHSRYAWISGESVNHVYPVRYLMCGKNGLNTEVNETINQKGQVVKVVASEKNYTPTNAGVDFNDGQVLCPDLPSNSTASEITAAAKSYEHKRQDNQNISCDFGAHTTGLGIDTSAQANNDIFVAMQYAQDAASINPLPDKILNEVDQTIDRIAYNQLHKTFPKAKIAIKPPVVENPLQQLENNWSNNKANIVNGLESYKLINSDGNSYFDFKSIYGGAVGQILLPVNFNNQETNYLNTLMHNKRSQ